MAHKCSKPIFEALKVECCLLFSRFSSVSLPFPQIWNGRDGGEEEEEEERDFRTLLRNFPPTFQCGEAREKPALTSTELTSRLYEMKRLRLVLLTALLWQWCHAQQRGECMGEKLLIDTPIHGAVGVIYRRTTLRWTQSQSLRTASLLLP